MIYANFAILLYCFHVFNFCVVNSFWKCLIDVINHCWGIGTYLVFSQGYRELFIAPQSFSGADFLHFRLKNMSKMQMIGLEKYKNSFGRNPALLQNKRWYHLCANADGWVWQMQSGQTSKSRYLQCANTNAWFWQIHEGLPYWCHLCDMANAYMLERSFI